MTPELQYFGLVVEDLATSLAFYRRLGLDVPSDVDRPHVEVGLPGGLTLAWDTEETIRTFDPAGERRMGMAFRCGDPGEVDQTYKELVNAGYGGHLEPWDAFWGQRVAAVYDPDGNSIEFFSPLVQKTDAELYREVQEFYAHQLPLLEAKALPEFFATFTDDAVMEHAPNGWRLEGRDQLLAAMQELERERERNDPQYQDRVYRHWSDRLTVEANGDELRVGYLSLVTVTIGSGDVILEPTTTVADVLVRIDGRLLTKSRHVNHDTPNWS